MNSQTAPALVDHHGLGSLADLLQHWQFASEQRCLLIVDAAQLEEQAVMRAMYAYDEDPHWCWLFEQSPLDGFADAGPVVIDTTTESALMTHALAHWAQTGLLLIVTSQPMDDAVANLRTLLAVNLEASGPCLLRPYDPRLLQVLSVCQPDRLAALTGADATWVWSVDLREQIYWNGFRATGDIPVIKTHEGQGFERTLSWISAWDRCLAAIREDTHHVDSFTRFIADQWHAGRSAAVDSGELKAQWQAFRQSQSTHSPLDTNANTADSALTRTP